jgi:hypothetical protein
MNPPVLNAPEPEAPVSTRKKATRKQKITIALVASVLVHAVILLQLSGIILIPGAVTRNTFMVQALPEDVPIVEETPDVKEETDDGLVAPETSDPIEQPTTNVEATEVANVANIDTSNLITAPTNAPAFVQAQGLKGNVTSFGSTSKSGKGKKAAMASPFGAPQKIIGGLTGYLYDFKQDNKGEKINSQYADKMKEFVTGDWSKKTFNDIYRSKKALYTTQIFIPSIDAEDAPKAFQANDIEPKNIAVLYTGKMTFPEAGDFRIVGFGDDHLFVRINGKVVLDGSLHQIMPELDSGENLGSAYTTPIFTTLHAGPWFTVEKGQTVPVEILLGEQPGGHFAQFVMFQKKGATYKMRSDAPDIPALPILQFVPTEIPPFEVGTNSPDVSEPEIFFGAEKEN